MNKEIRFGSFLREVSLKQQEVTYNDLTPKLKVDTGKGNFLSSSEAAITSIDVNRLLNDEKEIRTAMLPADGGVQHAMG